MNWNEKIDLIKSEFSTEEFLVPHLERKRILRNIETKFIRRDKNYYDLNNFNERFINWWDSLKFKRNEKLKIDLVDLINTKIRDDQWVWFCCEHRSIIYIYKAKKSALLSLIYIAPIYTKIFHIIELKFEYLMGIKLLGKEIEIKYCE
jgi:hypothetical protein